MIMVCNVAKTKACRHCCRVKMPCKKWLPEKVQGYFCSLLMPKSLKWILLALLLMLVVASAYRIAWISILDPEWPSGISAGRIYWLGLLVDAKYVAFCGLVLWLTSQIPGLHFFKSTSGKKLGLWMISAMVLFELLSLLGDFAALASAKSHLSADLLGKWLRPASNDVSIWKQMPVWPAIIGIGLFTWITFMVMRFAHHQVHAAKTRRQQGNRTISNAAFVIICLVLVFGVSLFNLLPEKQNQVNHVVTNVWQHFFAGTNKMAP